MQTQFNAKAYATGAARNVNYSQVDENYHNELLRAADALLVAIKGMQARGELHLAGEIVAEFQQARSDANNIARRLGLEEV